jgi:hypothetical protein
MTSHTLYHYWGTPYMLSYAIVSIHNLVYVVPVPDVVSTAHRHHRKPADHQENHEMNDRIQRSYSIIVVHIYWKKVCMHHYIGMAALNSAAKTT